ncbi:MAG: ABC transporter substrate-binding protein [Nanoarchaeota archaeon]
MRNLTYIIMISVLMIAASCSQTKTADTQTGFTAGVMAPMTGLSAALGKQMMQGVELAANESGNQIKLIIEDDQCDAKAGVTAAKKLIEIDHVDAILGPICTVAILPTAEMVEDAKTPRITTGMVVQKTASAGDYHFSFLPELKHQMNAIAKYAKAQGIKSVGTLALDDDLGREGISELKRSLARDGIDLTEEEYFDKAESDYRTMISKIKETNAQGIYVLGYSTNMIQIVKQADEVGFFVPILTWNLFQDPASIKLDNLSDSVVYTYPEDPRELSVKTAFKKRFMERFGQEPTLYAANAYDSYMILDLAVKSCGKDNECVKSKLASVKDYEGGNGFISVDDRGVGQRPEVSIKAVRNGKFVTIG